MRLYFSFILFTFSIISFSEPRLGKDFFLLNDPLPVKQDGIVEVTEVFGMVADTVMQWNQNLKVGTKLNQTM